MAGDTITQYLDDDGNPVGAGSDIKPPKGYSLLTSKKIPAAPNKKASVKELKILAAAKKPIVPPKGYIPEASVSAYTPSVFEQARSVVANSAIGHSLEEALPSIATALHLHPTDKIGTPQAAQHKEQLLAPEYLAPALTEAIRTGPLMGAPAPPEGRAPDATSNRIEGALTAAGGLTSGKSMATMGGIAAAAGLTAGVINPASAQVLTRLISGGFTLDMLHGLYQQHKEYRKAVDAGDINEAQKIQGEMGVTGVLALLTGKHALMNHPFTPIESKDIPVRERTNILHSNSMGSVRRAEGQTPTVWLNPDAWHSVMGQIYPEESSATTNGFNIPKKVLESHANDPQFAKDHPEIADLLTKAHEGSGDGGAAIAKKRDSIQDNVRVMREELNHSWQRNLAANGNYENHLKPGIFSHLKRQIPQGMYDHLLDNGYDGHDSPQMVAETAAKFLGGDIEKYNVSSEEAHDFLKSYLDEVVAEHGTKALDELKRIRGAGKTAKEATLAEHKGTANGSPDDGMANGSADRGVLPSVSAGGQRTPEPVQSAGGEGQDALFSRDKPTWYLKSERLIGDKMKGPQAAEDVHKMLISGGVKPEEMQWTGLDDFLKSKGKDKVTPEEIREHLANNNIQIKEVMKGGQKPVEWKSYPDGTLYTPEGYQIERILGNGMYRLKSGGGMTDVFNTIDEAKAQVDKYRSNTREDVVPTKFPTLVMPGAEPNSYREMILTMPTRMPHADALAEFRDKAKEKYGFPIVTEEGAKRFDTAEREEYDKLVKAADEEHAKTPPPFHVRAHWDEANPLSHVRFNDRTGPNGERLLHLEEIQSDWANKIRREGLKKSPEELAKIPLTAKQDNNSGVWEVHTDAGQFVTNVVDFNHSLTAEDVINEARRRIVEEPRKTANDLHQGHPDMPWKKNWHEQTLRRMLRYAVDKGYDALSWTGGEDQAERYDLSKQVDSIDVWRNGDQYGFTANKDGRPLTGEKTVSADKLADSIGKDLANKAIKDLDNGRDAAATRNYGGVDLKVGGEKHKRLYDKMIPDYLNKFGKKFGAKVGETEFKVPGDKRMTIRRGINGWDVESRIDENVGREQGLAFFSDEDYGGREGAQKAAQADAEERSAPSKTVQYLPITPEMRKSVAEEGVPLFNREQEKTPEFQNWFKGSKVVSPDGSPLMVYHGTSAEDNFDTFKTNPKDIGMHFGTQEQANKILVKYGKSDISGSRVMPAYLNIQNPLRMEDINMWSIPNLKAELGHMFPDDSSSISKFRSKEQVRDFIRFKGHDGIVYDNYSEGKGDSYIALDPKQIKSAIGNSGAFDPKDPNILRNREKTEDDKEDATPLASQDASTDLDVNTNTEVNAENPPEQVEVSTGTGLATIIPIQGGTNLASAPKQEPVVKAQTSVPHQTTRTVSVPLQTAIPDAPVVTTRVLPLAQLKAMAAQHNPQYQSRSVRDLMKEAKERFSNSIVP